MAPVDPSQRLGDLALAMPRRTRLFDQLRLDYCCGGNRTLAEACAQRQFDVDTIAAVIMALDDEHPDARSEPHDVASGSVTDLCDHILKAHHDTLVRELPRVAEQVATVVRVHGMQRPALRDLQRVFGALRRALEEHLWIEEVTLFPACRALEQGSGAALDAELLSAHEADHTHIGETLAALRELSGGYRLETALCGTHRRLLVSLRDLEREIHLHVHEENNILIPRVRALGAQLS